MACLIVVGSESRAGFQIAVDFVDPGDQYSSYRNMITEGLQSAADAWGQYVQTESVTLQITMNFTDEATASAGSLTTRYVSTTPAGVATYELGSIVKLVTGVDINGGSADAVFNFGVNWLQNVVWWNPDPGSSTPPPSGQIDSHYLFMHELGHILGFSSTRDADGNLPDFNGSPWQTTYDAKTTWDNGDLLFTGTNAEAAYGGPVALTYGNFSHVSNSSSSGRPGSDLVNDVMNGVVSQSIHYQLSGVDVGILADLGYNLTDAGRALVYGTQPPAVPEPASIIALTLGLAGLGAWGTATGRRRAA